MRICNQYDIRTAMKSKITTKTPHFVIKFSPSPLPTFSLVVIISKKVYKRANKRNRVRRKIHAVFEYLHYQNRLPPSIQCVIIVQNKDILFESGKTLENNLTKTLGELYDIYVRKVTPISMPK
jgi:ribonuclease P protein component